MNGLKDIPWKNWINVSRISLSSCGAPFPDPHFPFGPPAPYYDAYKKEQMPDPIAWDDSRDNMNEWYHASCYKARGEELY